MLVYLREVLLRLLCRGGTQTFVVLNLPLFEVLALSPLLKLVYGEKGANLIAFGCLEQRRHELLQEPVHVYQRGPEVMNEVYQ